MKVTNVLSVLLVAAPYTAHALPSQADAIAIQQQHTPALTLADLLYAPNLGDVDKRELNLGGLLGPLGKLLGNNGLTHAAQEIVAEFFKAGDVFLNLPLDVIEKILSGKPDAAVKTALEEIIKTLGSLPKDLERIIKALGVGPKTD